MAEKLFAINARKKFQQLDTDGSGYLEGEELLHLAEWVWSSFHPDGEPLSDDERAKMSDKLLHRLDENSDGKLSMAEFEEVCPPHPLPQHSTAIRSHTPTSSAHRPSPESPSAVLPQDGRRDWQLSAPPFAAGRDKGPRGTWQGC